MANDTQGEGSRVQVFAANVTGADKAAFPPVPEQLDAGQKDFLAKYQPLSDAALAKVAPVTQSSFSAAGFRFDEFPCLSVTDAAVALIGDQQEIERDQVAAILDRLTSEEEVTFGTVDGRLFSGLRIVEQGATLDVIGLPGSMASKVVGGMVFDMFKLQSDDIDTNAIRATQAQTDGSTGPLLALCLYPEGADALQTYHFCVGKNLDGSEMGSGAPADHTRRAAGLGKRGFLDDLFNTVCGILGC